MMNETTASNMIIKKFEIPDVPKDDDVNIEVHDGKLFVSAATKHANEFDTGDRLAQRSRQFETFARTLHLPPGVKDEDIKATMTNGVLTVIMPTGPTETQDPARATIS